MEVATKRKPVKQSHRRVIKRELTDINHFQMHSKKVTIVPHKVVSPRIAHTKGPCKLTSNQGQSLDLVLPDLKSQTLEDFLADEIEKKRFKKNSSVIKGNDEKSTTKIRKTLSQQNLREEP